MLEFVEDLARAAAREERRLLVREVLGVGADALGKGNQRGLDRVLQLEGAVFVTEDGDRLLLDDVALVVRVRVGELGVHAARRAAVGTEPAGSESNVSNVSLSVEHIAAHRSNAPRMLLI